MTTATEIVKALESRRYREATEADLQAGIASTFESCGIAFEREVRLSAKDRVDFLVGSIGVECKIGGSLADLIRQLHRYAQHESISELVVVTTRLTLARVPAEISGKRVHVVATMGGVL